MRLYKPNPEDGKQKKAGESKPRRSVRLAHELMHFALAEQKKRKGGGLPHTKLTDILDEWGMLGAEAAGYKHPDEK
jgi:hypothetical protein